MSKKTDDIEKTLNEFDSGLIDNIVNDNTLVFTAQDAETVMKAREERMQTVKEKTRIAEQDAKNLVNSARDLYSKTSSDIEYVKFKANADANSLGKIIYQVEVTEDAISTVVDSIKDGDTNTNLFKCLTDLQKTMLELLKTKNLYLSSIEDSFKQLTNDVEMSSAIEIDAEDETNVLTAKAKNGRELMKMIAETTNKIMEESKQKENEDPTNTGNQNA